MAKVLYTGDAELLPKAVQVEAIGELI